MKAAKIDRRLAHALQDHRIATVVRDDFEFAMTDGLVIAMSDDWVVLHALGDGVYLDDVVMLRRRDISRVLFRDDTPFHHRAIAALDATVATVVCGSNDGTRQMLEAASTGSRIIALHMEELDELAIGHLVGFTSKSVDVHYVGRDGVWADIERWHYRSITMIEAEGRYLTALERFADPRPGA